MSILVEIENELHFSSESTLEINDSTTQGLTEIQRQFNDCMLNQNIVVDEEQIAESDKVISNIVQKLLNHSQNLKDFKYFSKVTHSKK